MPNLSANIFNQSMKKRLAYLTLIILMGFFQTMYAQKEQKNVAFARHIKVACVGNSITYGANIVNRLKNSYPAQLQAYLGDAYEVRNFGISGRTLLSHGDLPYIQTNEYVQSGSFEPDIVLIKLGTNDTKPQNWKYEQEFISDYQKLIDYYRSLSSQPRIILFTPTHTFLKPGSEISSTLITNEVTLRVQKIAYDNNLEILNFNYLFGNQWCSHILPDRLHPSSIGAGLMAQKIGSYLERTANDLKKQPESSQLPARKLCENKGTSFNFHGFSGYDFSFDGIACKIVEPRVSTKGNPWIWRARFWGHEPQTDIAMLEAGFHIAYCDVADLYGSPLAVKRWDAFYKRMIQAGFDSKPVLEGMSRGGLIVYNWAMKNPKKVSCIYADAPVMDFSSWPMGYGVSEGSALDTKQLLNVYGFKSEAVAVREADRRLRKCAKRMAKAHIPILHVVGDADRVVPVADNTQRFAESMEKLHAPIQVIHKPNVDHHPHSLYNPQPIVDFMLRATGHFNNACVKPIPGNEFRVGAGWKNGNEWHSMATEIQQTLKGKKLKLLLIGNSITQGWAGSRSNVTHRPGKAVMDAKLGCGNWEAAGISGDCTQHVLYRIKTGGYNVCHPENVVIAIGINNLLAGNEATDVAQGIVACARAAVKEFPQSRILLLGLFPSGKQVNHPLRQKCDVIHQYLQKNQVAGVEYINPTDWFVDVNGDLRSELYAGDFIHLTTKGYECLAEKLLDKLELAQPIGK